MRKPLVLTSLDNPRLKRIVRLRKQRERRDEGVFVAEGTREVSRALAAGLKLEEIYWSPDMLRTGIDEWIRSTPGLREQVDRHNAFSAQVTPGLFAKMAYIENPEGLLAVFETPVWTMDGLPRGENSGPNAELYLVAAGISKPGNLGAMVRTAAAAGATAVLSDSEVDAFNPNAIRASTGAVYALPTIGASRDEITSFLKDRNVRVVVATLEQSVAHTQTDFRPPTAIVIGAEDTGVDEAWLNASAARVRIPMKPGLVDSLNASNAAAILLFEAVRQRNGT